MHTRLFQLVTSFFIILVLSNAHAAQLPIPKTPSTGAKAFIIMDFDSLRVVAEQESD